MIAALVSYEDLEDNYEDKHQGIDVREDENGDEKEDDDAMDLGR